MLPVPKSSLKWLVTTLVCVTKRKIERIEKLKNFLLSPLVNFQNFWLTNQIAFEVKRSPQKYIEARQSHIPSRLKQSAMEAPSSGILLVSLTSMWLPCFIFFSHHFFSLFLRQVQMMGPNGGLYKRSWVMRVLYQVLSSCLLTVTWLTNAFFCCYSSN